MNNILIQDNNFNRIDEHVGITKAPYTIYQTIMESLGASMLVLNFLDFYRLFNGKEEIALTIGGKGLYTFQNKCKFH